MANLEWGLYIWWYVGVPYEERVTDKERIVGYRLTRGRTNFVSNGGQGFEPMPPGILTITLDNRDGRYDPYNTGSSLYPHVEAGKDIIVWVDQPTFNYRFSGVIDSIVPTGGVSNPQVVITAYDRLKSLQEAEISVDTQQNIETGEAVRDTVEASGVGAYYISISGSADSIPYWHESNISAYDAINKICQYEFGNFFISDNNIATFYGRAIAPASVVTIDQSDMLKDVVIPMPYEVVRNCVKVYSYPKTLQSTAALWTLGDKPYVGPGETLEVWGDFKYDNRSVAAINTAAPVATTDYTMNTAEDGTGTNKTADFTVTATYFGETVKNVITNNGTAAGAYVTLLQNRGQAVDSPYTSYAISDTSGTDLKRMFIIDTPWMQDTNKAQQYADYLIDILGEPHKYPIFQLESQPDKQFAFDLLDRITVTMAKYGISQDFRVGGIEEEWLSDNGQAVLTTVYTEPFVTQSAQDGYWFFPETFPMIFPY